MSEILERYVDRGKFGSDTEFIIENLKRVEDYYDRLSNVRINIKGAEGLKATTLAVEEGVKANAMLTESVKAVERVVKDRFATEAKLATLQVHGGKVTNDYTIATTKNKVAISELTKEMRIQAQVDLAQSGSIQKAVALRAKMYFEQTRLNLATKEGAERSEVLKGRIDSLNNFIKKNSDQLTQQKINVGNYQGSAKIIVDSLEKEIQKLKELEKQRVNVANAGGQFKPGGGKANVVAGFGGNRDSGAISNLGSDANASTVEIKKLDDEIAKSRTIVEGFQRITSQPTFLNVAAKVGDANQEIKFFTKALIDLERQGQGNSQAAIDLRKHLAELTDQVGDAKAEIKALSSDTRQFDLFAGAVTFAADAMQLYAGAAALAGQSEEDTAEATKNLVAIQSVANGVKGIANELTTRGTAANKLFAFVQSQVAVATDSTAKAFTRMKAALIGIGIGVLLVAIGYLVTHFKELKEALGLTSKGQDQLNESLEDYRKGAADAIVKTEKVKIAFDQARDGVISKKEALFIYNKELGDAMGNATSLAEAEQKYNAQVGDYIQAMALRAQANSLFAKSGEALAAGIVAQTENQVSFLGNLKAGLLQTVGFAGGAQAVLFNEQRKGVEAAKRNAKELGDVLAEEGKLLLNNAEKLDKKSGNKTSGSGFAEEEAKNQKAANDKAKKLLEDKLKNQLDLEKRNAAAVTAIMLETENERIKSAQRILDNDNSSFADQLRAIEQISTAKKNINAINFANEIKEEKEVSDAKIIIKSKTDKEIEAIAIASSNRINDINQETLKAQFDAQKENSEKVKAQIEKDNELKMQALDDDFNIRRSKDQQAYDQEVTLLNNKFTNGTISQKKYNDEIERLQIEFQIKSLAREIKYQKALLELSSLTGPEKADALSKIAQLERELSDLNVQHILDNEGKKRGAILETLDKVKNTANSVFGLIDGLLNANLIKQKNQIKEQELAAEKKAADELTAVQLSGDSEEKKAARVILINARLETQKRQFTEREKQAELQKARFDKAKAIFDIILNTATAVIKVFPNPLLMGLAAGLGAAQLAIAIGTPIPKFFKGKDKNNKYEGWGTMNEIRPEIIEHADGTIEMPVGQNILKYIQRDDIIHTDANDFMTRRAVKDVQMSLNGGSVANPNYTSLFLSALNKQQKTLDKIANKEELHLNGSAAGVQAMWKHANTWVKWIDQQTTF